jgi:hypothetical protein
MLVQLQPGEHYCATITVLIDTETKLVGTGAHSKRSKVRLGYNLIKRCGFKSLRLNEMLPHIKNGSNLVLGNWPPSELLTRRLEI